MRCAMWGGPVSLQDVNNEKNIHNLPVCFGKEPLYNNGSFTAYKAQNDFYEILRTGLKPMPLPFVLCSRQGNI